jgi:hypothetical protein
VEELHTAIADYLREHNPRILTPCPPPVALDLVRCRSCGQPIMAEAEPGTLGYLLAARCCLGCYLREAA